MFKGPPPREIAHHRVPDAPEHLRLVRNGTAGAPIVLFHALGGRLSGSYLPLISRLPRDRAIYLVLAAHTEPLEHTVEALARRYVETLTHIPGPNLHLCGWSLGGAIAFESARLLLEQDRKVGFVGLIDTWLNMALQQGKIRSAAACRRSDYLRYWYLMKLCGGYIDGAEDAGHSFWSLPEAAKLVAVEASAVRRYPEPFAAMGSAAFSQMYSLFDSLWTAGDTYVPTPIPVPITYFASEDAEPAIVHHWTGMSPAASVVICRGDHNSMMDITNGSQLAGNVMKFLVPRDDEVPTGPADDHVDDRRQIA